MEEDKKKIKYLALFGLQPHYSLAELKKAYRTLAKLYHPDLKKSTVSEMRMVLLNQGYCYLQESLPSASEALQEVQATKQADEIKVVDTCYAQYRKAFDILKQAFDNYYGENNKQHEHEHDLEILQRELYSAKKEFGKILTDYSYNEWVDDAIDKIVSINKWLT